MKKLKIQDLKVGKFYRAFYKGVEHGIYKIGNNKELFTRVSVKNIIGWEESKFYYNELINDVTFEEIKREIDWTKVPRGTKVQVSLTENGDWFNRYFIDTDKEYGEYAFVTSLAMDDDFTGYEMEDYPEGWEYCRIHPTVQIPEKWYKEE